ncbi:Uncharacterised protein [Vibrio cholerae]|nr:Uncharacterised protein [Vibrio cholerae]CSB35111.1 Uncharacterised protein [Vibrio cholerae]CSB75784.1 Uncharacterised protein [Vibrio cholerae]CSC35314.1 Uncharacterised protein [Vibrio cholerae]CSC89082.1 Uncharacterised protein [Vibrio cholerae]
MHVKAWIIDEAMVERQDVQHIEMLTLVLMQTFDLHIENRIGIELDAHVIFHPISQTRFVGFFHFHKAFLERGIFGVLRHFGQLVQLRRPLMANLL